jgi:3-oxoacyl-(acyl-carrier-protein) synthase
LSRFEKIGIVAFGSSSALGGTQAEVWNQYLDNGTCIRYHPEYEAWVASLNTSEEEVLERLLSSDKRYQRLDRSVLLAMLAAKRAVESALWGNEKTVGLCLGSSRGATGAWEAYFEQFRSRKRQLPPQASPLSTAGNLATHTAQYVGITGFASDQSITCSSAVHALANAVVWLESRRYDRFLAGGAEAPLTPFTIAQMKALKIYADADLSNPYPNRSLDLNKAQNTMVLGEGSAVFALERSPEQALAWINGLGYAREDIASMTSVSEDGIGLQIAMRNALDEAGLTSVDAVICHCPGTRLGDQSEYAAIQAVFGERMPRLTSNKWKIGHTLGASGALSLELALLMIKHQEFIPVPYLGAPVINRPIRHVMVNALGFGGNAISVILEAA